MVLAAVIMINSGILSLIAGDRLLSLSLSLFSADNPMPAVKPYDSEAAFIDHITQQLKQVAKIKGDK